MDAQTSSRYGWVERPGLRHEGRPCDPSPPGTAGLQCPHCPVLLLLLPENGAGVCVESVPCTCWGLVGAQVSRPKAQALILVCGLLTKASGLFTKPPTEVTIGQTPLMPVVPRTEAKPTGGWGLDPWPGRPYHLGMRWL